MRTIKLSVLLLAKYFGLFRLSKRLTKSKLRILHYHGVWTGDRPHPACQQFVGPETFRRRLALLKRRGYPVVSLQEGVTALAGGRVRHGSVVIAIDEGWASTQSHMVPALTAMGMTATVYLTNWPVEQAGPVLNALENFVWQQARGSDAEKVYAVRAVLAEAEAAGTLGAARESDRLTGASLGEARTAFTRFYERLPLAAERLNALKRLAELLSVDVRPALRERWFDLMTPDELREVRQAGIEVQLRADRDRVSAATIAERDGEMIEDGLNSRKSFRHGLKRFLDSQSVTELEFEAYVSGFSELVVTMKRRLRRRPALAAKPVWSPGGSRLPVPAAEEGSATA